MKMEKVTRKTVDFGRGIKVTVERPYTAQDAVEDFKIEVKKIGGKVEQGVHDEVVVSNLMKADADRLLSKLSTDLKGLGGAEHRSYDGLSTIADIIRRVYDKPKGVQFIFAPEVTSRSPSLLLREALELANASMKATPFVSPTGRRAEGPEMQNIKTPPFKSAAFPEMNKGKSTVAGQAPKALSTWDFKQTYLQRLHGHRVHLVGQHYRRPEDRRVLDYKKRNNMALLVAEPDNPHDLNAVMVMMWDDGAKEWRHVGYVRATEAALVRSLWTGDYRTAVVARITDIPSNVDGHRDGRNIELTLTGEVRDYPGYKKLVD